jgi:hypothetical protein
LGFSFSQGDKTWTHWLPAVFHGCFEPLLRLLKEGFKRGSKQGKTQKKRKGISSNREGTEGSMPWADSLLSRGLLEDFTITKL